MYFGLQQYVADPADDPKVLNLLGLIPNATLEIMESKLRMEHRKLNSKSDSGKHPKYISIIALNLLRLKLLISIRKMVIDKMDLSLRVFCDLEKTIENVKTKIV